MKRRTPSEQFAVYGWSPLMITPIATAYTGRTSSCIARAVREGKLEVAGRNGRSRVFSRDALDAWLLGSPTKAAKNSNPRATAPAMRTHATAPTSSALDRINALRRGGKP